MQINKTVKAVFGVAMAAVLLVGTSASAYTFTSSLKLGSKGTAVKELQKVLNMSADTQVATAGKAGSPGMETTTFGPATKSALQKFQAKNNLSPLTGATGPGTRAALNAISNGSTPTTPTTPTQTGPVTAMLAATSPASGTILTGQATADLLHVTFNGTGTVTNVTLQRTGLALNEDLSAVYLYQGATRLTESASVNSSGAITFSGLNLMVNGSTTVSVRADIKSGSASASSIGVTMTGFTASGSAVTTNIAGNVMYVSDGSLLLGGASVTMANTSNSTASVNAGVTNYTFWTAPVQVSTHTMSLKGASFRFVGSAPTNSISNLGLYVDGTKVGSSTGVNAYSYVVFDLTSAPFNLTTGSHTFDVRGDVVNGAGRTAQLSLQNAGDLMITDSTLNVNVAATAAGANQTAFPLSGNTVTISNGSLAISIDPTFTAMTTVTGGATNAVIARYKVNAYGEDEKITSITLTPTITGGIVSSGSSTNLNNVQLYLNGSQIGSVCQYTGTACTFTLGSSAVIPAGVTSSTLEVRADLQNNGGYNYTGGSIAVSSSAIAAQGLYSFTTLTSPVLPTTTGLTISTGQLVVAKNAAYTNQTLSPNTANVKIGSFVLQNQSTSESVRVTNLAIALLDSSGVALTTTAGTGPELNDITSVTTSETSGSGSIPQNAAASLNYTVDFTIAPGATKNVDVFANLGSTVSVGMKTTLVPTAYGVSSNVSLTPSAVTGQTISIATGSVSAPSFIASSSTTPQYIATALTGTDASKETFQFTATNGSGTVSELKFAVVGATSGTVSSVRVGSTSASVITPSAITTASTNIYGTAYASTATRFTVSSTANIPVGTILTLGATDMALVTSVPSATEFVVTRGVIGSTAAAVATGATITPSGLAYLTGLNLNVPNGTSGAYIDAFATYSPANGTTGAITSSSASKMYLTYVKSQIGSRVSGAATTPAPASLTSNLMTVVGSKPTLSIDTNQKTGLVLSAENKIGEVTITADAAGTIGIKTLTFTVGGSGFATGPLIATGARLADGSTTISTATVTTTSSGALTTVVTVTFTSDYLITAGASKTFSLYGTPSGTITSGATVSLSTGITSAGFTWTDTAGNGTSGAETGAKIYNFPTGSYSIRQ